MKFNNLKHFAAYWHRNIGIMIVCFALLLAVTGILIQHSHTFKLDHTYISNRFILSWYGVEADPISSYRTNSHWISHAGHQLYLNEQVILGHYSDLDGATEFEEGIAIISNKSLILIDHEGKLIDTLSPQNGLPEPMLGIANGLAQPVLRGAHRYWESNRHFTQWRPYEGIHPVWITPTETPHDIATQIQKHNISTAISFERFLLDLHSGRLLGSVAVYFMDGVAIAIILLGFSGIYVWNGRRKN